MICQLEYTAPDIQVTLSTGSEQVSYTTGVFELLPGWQLLQISSTGALHVNQIRQDQVSMQSELFTAYALDQTGTYRQPAGQISPGETYNIWLHSDPSVLKERVLMQLSGVPRNQDLNRYRQCYYNLGRRLDHSYGIMRHYAGRAEGPNWHLINYRKCPFTITDLKADKKQFWQEITADTSWQNRQNSSPWHSDRIRDPADPSRYATLETLPFPQIKKWLISSGIAQIGMMNINLIRPGARFEMHTDADPFPGSQVLYVPLHDNPDSFLKVSSGGILPVDQICLLNNRDFVHGAVSAPDHDRYVLLFIANYPDDWVRSHQVAGPYWC
jgi:hypothetical protein